MADVFKHVILSLLFSNVNKKESAYTFFDTHSGAGLYDLQASSSKKTLEAEAGIQRLWAAREQIPSLLQTFLSCLIIVQHADLNPAKLKYYHGSPWLASHLTRAQDKIILNEHHPLAYQALKDLFHEDKRVHIHKRDAYECLLGLLPPKTVRGIVFIDPPYERKQEWSQITELLSQSLSRFRQGIYLLWYPLTRQQSTLPSSQALRSLLKKHEHQIIECFPTSLAGTTGLIGSGMLLIHPPYGLVDEIRKVLPFLCKVLSCDQSNKSGNWRIYTL
jgi:23S rRNA (adenine2030-N6)-methyltransferase